MLLRKKCEKTQAHRDATPESLNKDFKGTKTKISTPNKKRKKKKLENTGLEHDDIYLQEERETLKKPAEQCSERRLPLCELEKPEDKECRTFHQCQMKTYWRSRRKLATALENQSLRAFSISVIACRTGDPLSCPLIIDQFNYRRKTVRCNGESTEETVDNR